MKKAVIASALGLAAMGAQAQSSVTLYGIIDTSVAYLNNVKTTSNGVTSSGAFVGMGQGVWGGNRWGLKGREDLGGGTAAIFQLENGFNSANGATGKTGLMFDRGAWVGLTNANYGTLQAGRQYTPYYLLLSPWSPTTWLTGYFGAHPGDIDNLDTDYRVNNALTYTSPVFAGLTVSGMYAFGGQPGSFSQGQSWSIAAQYKMGGAGLGVGYERFNNATVGGGAWSANSTAYSGTGEQGNSSLTAGYQTAAAQNRLAVTGGYTFNQFDVSAAYSNVQYVPGVNSSFVTKAIFNTAGLALHYHASTVWDLAAGYAYTRATTANGVTSAASYNQFNLTQLYNLSKRSRIYVLEAYQRANGQTLNSSGKVVNATANLGDQGVGSSGGRSQVGFTVGINHQF
ncbi:porin [Paraburkholderia adhaesiva]|uniref:porin n=1 Tax=Paraburkholderia adhaesiva TaxID=2883244 RepID=UPI001F1D3388|nr:porin [Paraburkholderia adhaesiva]